MANFDIKTHEINKYKDTLKAGDSVSLTGYMYTARDAAHKKLCKMIDDGIKLPFDENFTIYYAGPSPSKPNQIIGSCGPTTSGRMDPFAEKLMQNGMSCMIGKGKRADYVIDAMKKYNCIYLAAVGGAGAIISDCIKSVDVICFEELGCESVKKIYVENFKVFVATDTNGNSLYK